MKPGQTTNPAGISTTEAPSATSARMGRGNIAAAFSSGTPPDPDATRKMQWTRTMAFRDAELQLNPGVNAFSDIDGHQVNTPWRQPLGAFQLFEFAAKFDPVPAMTFTLPFTVWTVCLNNCNFSFLVSTCSISFT